MAFTPGRDTRVYVTNFASNFVSVIRTDTRTVVKTFPVGTGAEAVAVTPDGTHVYVANFISNTVSVFARPGNALVATIPVGNAPSWLAFTPHGRRAYVANRAFATVSVIREEVKPVAHCVGWGLTPSGRHRPGWAHAYVANQGSTMFPRCGPATWCAIVPVGTGPSRSPLPRTGNTCMPRIGTPLMSR